MSKTKQQMPPISWSIGGKKATMKEVIAHLNRKADEHNNKSKTNQKMWVFSLQYSLANEIKNQNIKEPLKYIDSVIEYYKNLINDPEK